MKTSRNGIFLYKLYRDETDAFTAHLDKTKTDLTSETVHAVRVDIKKIRSFFILLNMIKRKKFSRKHRNVFKELFGTAGDVRENFVNTDLFGKYISPLPDMNGFKKFCGLKAKKLETDFLKAINNFNFEDFNLFETRVLRSCCDTAKPRLINKCRKLILSELKKVPDNFKNSRSTVRFHKLRRHLRVLRDVMDLYLKLEPDKKIRRAKRKIKLIEDHLGKWHDRAVLCDSISDFMQQESKEAVRSVQLRELICRIRKDSEAHVDSHNLKL